MYPRILIDMKKLEGNLDAVAKITKEGGCSLMIVTKGVCADPEVTKMIARHPAVSYMADSRVENLRSYAADAREHGKQTVLLRLPMMSQAAEVVDVADISFNSELVTIKALDEAAAAAGKTHKIVLMIDLGDLREGIFFEKEDEIYAAVEQILALKNIELYGVAVNLTCYGAIIPKNDNLSNLARIAGEIEKKFSIKLPIVSGGNSSSIYLIGKGELPAGINNLRLGESFFLGNDTAYFSKLPGTVDDAITLEAEIIELKEKPSLPIGEVGKDAFGQVPVYEDKGLMMRAIVAVGQQDVALDSVEPVDEDLEVMGASSDHMIVDVTHSAKEYKVGDVISFKLGYGGMLRTTTSAYVERAYK